MGEPTASEHRRAARPEGGELARAASVLVSGASGGLGGAVVSRLAADGWRVLALSRTPATATVIAGGEGIVALAADATDPDAVAAALASCESAEAPLRAVVNLVGGYAAGARVHQTPVGEFEAVLRLNLRPTYVVTAAALPGLVAAGGGSVVCVSSRAAVRPFSGAAGYITAKAAVLAFVDAVAVEYAADGVRANAVLPSIIDTPANRAAQPGADVTRWVAPGQIADVIAFLCSEASVATSGAHIAVYGRA